MDSVAVIKFISILLYPVGLVLVFFVLGFLGRALSQKGVLRILANACYFISFLCFVAFSNPLVATWLVKSLEQQYPQSILSDIAQHDAVIVLGGGLRVPSQPAQYTQLNAASDRYWFAVRLFRAGKVANIILAGGNVYQQQELEGEAFYASQLIQEWGVPETIILLDDQSRTTEQNRDNAAQIIDQNGFTSVLLVTSAIHMPRAVTLFEKIPVSVTPASADIIVRQSDSPKVFAWLPSASALMLSTAALHEYYGMWFIELKALISKA